MMTNMEVSSKGYSLNLENFMRRAVSRPMTTPRRKDPRKIPMNEPMDFSRLTTWKDAPVPYPSIELKKSGRVRREMQYSI